MLTPNTGPVHQNPNPLAAQIQPQATPPDGSPIGGAGAQQSPITPVAQILQAPLQPAAPMVGASPATPLQMAPLFVSPGFTDLLNPLLEQDGSPIPFQNILDQWIQDMVALGVNPHNAAPQSAGGSNQHSNAPSSQVSYQFGVPHSGHAEVSHASGLQIGPGGSADSIAGPAPLNPPALLARNLMAEFDNARHMNFEHFFRDPRSPVQSSAAETDATQFPGFVTPACSAVGQPLQSPRTPRHHSTRNNPFEAGLPAEIVAARNAQFDQRGDGQLAVNAGRVRQALQHARTLGVLGPLPETAAPHPDLLEGHYAQLPPVNTNVQAPPQSPQPTP